MKEQSTYSISQDYEIIQPKKGKVYPILIQEWLFIKTKVGEIKIKINFYHTLGSILIGAALSFLATNLATEFKNVNTETVCWGIFVVALICGSLCFVFGETKRKEVNSKPNFIIDQMDLIETRFESHE